jgi:hypothetical protein
MDGITPEDMKDFRLSEHGWFVRIAQDSLERVLDSERRLAAISKKLEALEFEDSDHLTAAARQYGMDSAQLQFHVHYYITVVFAAMAIEAHIYDYAARHFSDSFVKKHLDRLDVVSKWVIIPQLATGKEFPRGGKALQLLRELTKARNDLVHYKSAPLSSLSSRSRDVDEMAHVAKRAVRAMRELAWALERIDPEESESFMRLSQYFPAEGEEWRTWRRLMHGETGRHLDGDSREER